MERILRGIVMVSIVGQMAAWPIPTASTRGHNGKMRDLLVVGAGLAGLALARDLVQEGWTVQLLDKSRGVGAGRLPAGWSRMV